MSSSRMTLLKIAGVAGREVMAKMARWHEAAKPLKHGWGEGAYPRRMRVQADTLAARLLACRVESPVVYRCDWTDGWSSLLPNWTFMEQPQAKVVMGDLHLLWAWPLPDGGALARLAKAQARRRRVTQEARWFHSRLLEAEKAWSFPGEEACLLMIRETVGGSWTNQEVKAGFGVGLRQAQARAPWPGQKVHSRVVRI